MSTSPSQQAFFNSFRLERSRGTEIDRSGGSGFLFEFNIYSDGGIICLVTAKHCIHKYEQISFLMPRVGDDGARNPAEPVRFELQPQDFIYHPEDSVDLCIAPIGKQIKALTAAGKRPSLVTWNLEGLIDQEKLSSIKWIEDVFVVGCPFRIYDEINLIPVARRATTATPIHIDYKGRREFLIDAHIYKGSSGSPVALIDEGVVTGPGGTFAFGVRSVLLGIVVRSLNDNVDTELGLAECIKAERLLDFVPILIERNGAGPGLRPEWREFCASPGR